MVWAGYQIPSLSDKAEAIGMQFEPLGLLLYPCEHAGVFAITSLSDMD
jgi:hypothetical protein